MRRLVVCLAPGDGGAPSIDAAAARLGDLARAEGCVVVYPVSHGGGSEGAAFGGAAFGGQAAAGVVELAEHVAREHDIDPDQVVLAGLSSGGRALFEVAARAPGTFAALVAVPGAAAAELDLSGLADTPVWLRVGALDSAGWREQVAHTAARLEALGAPVDFAVIEDQEHELALGDQGLFDWLADVLDPGPRRLRFPAPDGLPIEADLYGSDDRSRPVLLLCHQARSSRGEYASIAPRLVDAGYTCLAIDQRAGAAMNGVTNETARRAAAQGRATAYTDARVDIEAALDWIREAGFSGPLALWGSSYSASLALVIGAEREDLAALLCFSPGEYFRGQPSVVAAAAEVRHPVLVVSPEAERDQCEPLVEALGTPGRHVVAEGIVHGSSTLFDGTQSDLVWTRVLAFLSEHMRRSRDD